MKPMLSSEITRKAIPVQTAVSGALYYFDLQPLLDRMGASGLATPDRLRAICKRHIRSIAGEDFTLFTDQGFYLVITSCSGAAAAGFARFINMSLLMLLFGTESLTPEQEMRLFRPIEPHELPEGNYVRTVPQERRPMDRVNLRDTIDGRDAAPEHDIENDTLAGFADHGIHAEQGVELIFFPVHDLATRTVSSLFCAPTFAGAVFGYQAFHDLGQAEMPYIDRAILMHGLKFARRLAHAGIHTPVGVPVSFETLSWSKSRDIYQSALRAANIARFPQLVIKVDDIPAGTPADRIARVVSSLKPFARFVSVHLPNNNLELSMMGRMGASGLVLSLPRRAAHPEVLANSKWLAAAAAAQNATACIDHVESDDALAVVRSAGVHFAVGNVFGAETLRGTASMEEVRTVLQRIIAATAAHLPTA
jgi:hypothetical protein